MSTRIETLNKIFNRDYIEQVDNGVSEPSINMKRSFVKGSIVDNDILVCRLDRGNDLFPYLRGDSKDVGFRGMKRICDYVVFVDHKGIVYVLLFELKKGKLSPEQQLEVSEPFVEFILNRAHRLDLIDKTWIVRKLGITDEPDKRPTSSRGEVVYDSKNYAKLYFHKHIYLERLLH